MPESPLSAPTGAERGPDGQGAVFPALLRNQRFQLLWWSNLLFFTAMGCQTLILGWLAYETTQSALGVAVFAAVRYAPMLFGVVAGAYADRVSRVRMLLLAASCALLVSALLAGIAWTGQLPFSWLVIGGFVLGLSESPSQPARSSLVFDLVGAKSLSSANSLNAMTTSLTQVLGPAAGGALFAGLHAAGSLGVVAVLYLVSAVLLVPLRRVPVSRHQATEKLSSMILSGLRAAAGSPVIVGVLAITLASNLLIWPILNSFMPIYAELLELGADGLGYLLGCCSAGGLVGSLVLARLGDFRFKTVVFWWGTAAWGLAWAGFALSIPRIGLAVVAIVVVGVFSAVFGSLRMTLLLLETAPQLHGRVLGLLEFAIGAIPVSTLVLGAVVEQAGVVATTFVASMIFVLVVIVVGLLCLNPASSFVRRYGGRDAEIVRHCGPGTGAPRT
nr:MFS transporter [Propionicimonas sp.]